MKCMKPRRSLFLSFLLSSSLLFGGCTQEAAKSLKDTAKLFGQESIAAIDAVEIMIIAETQEPIQTGGERKVRFLQVILDQQINDRDLTSNFEPLMQPISPSNQSFTLLKLYMANLKNQYTTLVSIYNDLERGHLFAKDAVKKSQKPLQKLTFQMSYLAICADAVPANLIKHKSIFYTEVIRLRRAYFNTNDPLVKKDIEGKLLEKFAQWEQIKAQEEILTQSVIEHATKASLLGRELSKQIEHYDDINLERLNSMLVNVINIVSLGTGQEYATLKKEVNQVWETINNDPDYKAVAESILEELRRSNISRGQSNLDLTVQGCSVLFPSPETTATNLIPSTNILGY